MINLAKQKPLIVFSVSSMAYVAIQMIFGLAVLRWIQPSDMGLWTTASIAAPYISFLQLGIFAALNRELPFLLGKGERERAINLVKTTANHANHISFLILAIAVSALVILYVKESDAKYLWVIAFFGAGVLLKTQQNYLVVTYRSAQDFEKLGFIYLSIIPVYILSFALVYLYGFYGFLVFQVLAPLVLVGLLYRYRPYQVRPKFSKESFYYLLKTGIPFFSLSFIGGLAPTFKKIIILSYLGTELLGLFAPALAILAVGRVLPGILGQFVYPRMSKIYGQTSSGRQVWNVNATAILITALLALPVVYCLNLLLPYMFEFVFPEYQEAFDATRITLISIILVVPHMAYNSLKSVKAFGSMTIVTGLKIAIYWYVIVFAYKSLGGLSGIAWGIVISDALFSAVILSSCYYELVLRDRPKLDRS